MAGKARQAWAWLGMVGLGDVGFGVASEAVVVVHGTYRLGKLRQGMSRTVWAGNKERRSQMIYTWRPGSHHKVPASVAGAECSRLESEGRLTAEALVDENREEGTPLHDEFEWRDDLAAEEWRKQQARLIINSLVVVSEQHEPVRSFINLVATSPKYTSVHTAVSQTDTRELLLQNALRELIAFQKKYKNLTEFVDLFAEIERLTA